jgi:hypothetical protein
MTDDMTTTSPDPTWRPAVPLGRERELTEAQRADIARWVVTMRRAVDAGVPQTDGSLRDAGGYCCLGLWCEIAEAAGKLQRRANASTTEWAGLGEVTESAWRSGSLPHAARLGGQEDPELIQLVKRDDIGDDAGVLEYVTAAELNDDHDLDFDQIADVVAWSFGVTPEELAAAELAPRVPAVE